MRSTDRAPQDPSLLRGATREPILAVLKELDGELDEPGHVTYDAEALARERIAPSDEENFKSLINHDFMLEIMRALHEKRDADALRLARLQWRVGRTYYLGGRMGDFFQGFSGNAANLAIIAEAPWLSDQECRDILREARALETSQPDFETLRKFDDYWISVTTGWRDRLHDSACWLTGVTNYDRRRSRAAFEDARRNPLGSLRVVQHVLALELYRREHGRVSNELATVRAAYNLPEIMDPHTPFAPVFRRTEDGYLLYSVGLDGADNGGKFPPPNISRRPDPSEDINLISYRVDVADVWRIVLEKNGVTPPPPKPEGTPPAGDGK